MQFKLLSEWSKVASLYYVDYKSKIEQGQVVKATNDKVYDDLNILNDDIIEQIVIGIRERDIQADIPLMEALRIIGVVTSA